MAMNLDPCWARRPTDPTGHYPCELRAGHTSPVHMDRDNDTWRNDMAQCGEVNDKNHRCGLAPQHPGACQFVSVTANADDIPAGPLEGMCGLDIGNSKGTRPCRLSTGHDGEHSDTEQCPSTIGRRGEGENRDLVIYRCDGSAGHGGVHHNEEHKHAWNQDEYPFETIPADTLTGRPTEDIIREMAERVTRLEGKVQEAAVQEARARVAGPGLTHLSVAALTSQLRKLTEALDHVTRLESPAPVIRCNHQAPGRSMTCELNPDHMGRHESGNSSWPKRQAPSEPCPVTVRANVSGSIPWNCILHRDHEGMHSDSEGYTWDITGL